MARPLGEDRVQLNHLNLRVRDLERSRGFYERYFGFDAGPAEWQAETFVVRNEVGFALALTPDPRSGRPVFISGSWSKRRPSSVGFTTE